jgi:hypothetical protein
MTETTGLTGMIAIREAQLTLAFCLVFFLNSLGPYPELAS